MKSELKEESWKNEEWKKWKSLEFDIVGRIELNYDLYSLFKIDTTKARGIQVFIKVTDSNSGQERIIYHMIPVFTHDIRPLEFEAGIKNEFKVIVKHHDGKSVKMDDVIVTVTMIIDDNKKQHEEVRKIKFSSKRLVKLNWIIKKK